jgi:hypothetical protein
VPVSDLEPAASTGLRPFTWSCEPLLRDEDAALAEIPRLLLVGFLERQRTGGPASAVQELPLTIDLDLDTPLAMIADLAVQLPAILPDGPEVFTDPRLTRDQCQLLLHARQF